MGSNRGHYFIVSKHTVTQVECKFSWLLLPHFNTLWSAFSEKHKCFNFCGCNVVRRWVKKI